MFDTLTEAIYYLPAFRAYHWQLLEELYNDNVMYAELRISLKEVSIPVERCWQLCSSSVPSADLRCQRTHLSPGAGIA